MEKLLRPKDKILLGLAFFTDLLGEFIEPCSVTIRKIHGVLPPDYKSTNLYSALYRSLKTGEIERIVENGKPYYQITSLGKKKLIRKFPLFALQKQKWDGYWRVVIFDIREKASKLRKRLRSELVNLGFAMWQRSVYITPFNVAEDVRDFLVVHGLKDEVYVLVAKELFAGDVKRLVEKIWQLEEINDQYKDLMEDWEWAKARFSRQKIIKEAQKCWAKYIQLLTIDPFLPKNYCPKIGGEKR